ncbi:hypothetical protein FQN57_003649 [Myotisia sp. PD_48]|nr:hypothetical protein FQN57_003649 [Myotisia sp. PD_48]
MIPPDSIAAALDYISIELVALKPLIPTYIHLLVSTLFALYIGSHASLARPPSAGKPPEKRDTEGQDEDTDEDEEHEESHAVIQKMGALEPSDALIFPIMAGLSLTGLYLMIQYFDLAYLNKILNWYFSHASFFFVARFLRDGLSVLRSVVFPSRYTHNGVLWKASQKAQKFYSMPSDGRSTPLLQHRTCPLPGVFGSWSLSPKVSSSLWRFRGILYQRATFRIYIRSIVDLKAPFSILDVIGIICAAVTVLFSIFVTKPWYMINFFGFAFCYGSLQFMSPTTFWTGSLILSSLFFYDIYFVFFTPMMVTVAKSLDLPIKLLFPRPSPPGKDTKSLAMLGLGDIVVPGMVIALALRFDLYLYYLRKQTKVSQADGSDKNQIPYKTATGGWGERLWSRGHKSVQLSEREQTYHEGRLFPKTYFTASVVGYTAGIIATLLSMQFSNHPQPALLFLVPGVLISLWGTGYIKGDIQTMWNFSDEVEEEVDELEDDEKSEESAENFLVIVLTKLINWIKGDTPDSSSAIFLVKYLTRLKNWAEGENRHELTAGQDSTSRKPKKPKSSESPNKAKEEKKPAPPSELMLLSISLPDKADHSSIETADTPTYTPSATSADSSSSRDLAKTEQPPLKKRRNRRKQA